LQNGDKSRNMALEIQIHLLLVKKGFLLRWDIPVVWYKYHKKK